MAFRYGSWNRLRHYCRSSLSITNMSLLDIWFVNTSLIYDLPFHFLNAFWRANIFNLGEVQFIDFFPHLFPLFCVFWVTFKKYLPNPRSFRFHPMLVSRIFIVLLLTFRSIIHFKLIFYIVWCNCQNLFLFPFLFFPFFLFFFSFYPHSIIYWKDYPFPIEYHWYPHQKLIEPMFMGLFLDSLFYCIELCVYANTTVSW